MDNLKLRKIAEPLVESIIEDIKQDEQLNRLDSFVDLHEFCDANTLGTSEQYFDKYGVEVVEFAQQTVNEIMPVIMACRFCGQDCESGECGCCDDTGPTQKN